MTRALFAFWNLECHNRHALVDDELDLVGGAIRRLLREPGHPLDVPTRRLMEDGLSSEFADVVVHTSDLAHGVNCAEEGRRISERAVSIRPVSMRDPLLWIAYRAFPSVR